MLLLLLLPCCCLSLTGFLNLATALLAPNPLLKALFSSSCTVFAETTGAPGIGGITPPPRDNILVGTDNVPEVR